MITNLGLAFIYNPDDYEETPEFPVGGLISVEIDGKYTGESVSPVVAKELKINTPELEDKLKDVLEYLDKYGTMGDFVWVPKEPARGRWDA